MPNRVRDLVRTACWLLPPGRLKNRVLRLLGHDIAPTARIGLCLVVGGTAVRVGAGSVVGHGNVFRGLRSLEIGADVIIGQFNWFSTAPSLRDGGGLDGVVRLDDHAVMTSRHYVDASGGLRLGRFASIAGVRCTVLTHTVDLETGKQTTAPAVLAEHAFLSTNCLLMAGCVLEPRAVLAAGSVTAIGQSYRRNTLFGGVPAKPIREIDGAYFHRTKTWIGR
ncbi:acyltransferase [Lentzea sp. NPDC060358]|uniref:acyltransferase n=1 Tax=Lentzea sp. NPDC060358 TaxID=3347103 RepID=UPI0036583D2B